MCGLFGWQFKPGVEKEINIHTLASVLSYSAQERGHDSWGVAAYRVGAEVEITKGINGIRETCSPRQLLSTQLMGHTRAATHGTISIENAHPFVIGKIIGSHNGVLQNHQSLNNQYNRAYAVDSQHIFAHLAASLPLTELQGHGAVTYINQDEPGVIHFGRSQGSALTIAGIGTPDATRGLIWGSSYHWIKEVMGILRFRDFFEYEVTSGHAYKTKDFMLYDDGPFEFGSVVYTPPAHQGRIYEDTSRLNYLSGTWLARYNERRAKHGLTTPDAEKRRHDLIEDYNTPAKLAKLNATLKKKVLKSEMWRKGKLTKLLKQISNAMGVRYGAAELVALRKMLTESPSMELVPSTSVINAPPSGLGTQELPHVDDYWYDG